MNTQPKELSRQKILDRIRKLYAMSQESEASPHEAEIALRRCQALMDRYGVCETDLKTSDFDKTTAYRFTRQLPTHINVLACGVGLLHDCVVVKMPDGLQYRGYAIDTQAAQLTFEYLETTLKRMLQQAKKSGSVGAGRSASHDYRLGFALEVFKRCQLIDEERKVAQQNTATGTALVTQKLAMVHAHCTTDLKRAKKHRVAYRDSEDTLAGREAGSQVSFNSQVQSTSKQKLGKTTE